jgi:hypothetical protein
MDSMKNRLTIFTQTMFARLISTCYCAGILWFLWNSFMRIPLNAPELSFQFFFCSFIFVKVLLNLYRIDEIVIRLNNLSTVISFEIMRQIGKDTPPVDTNSTLPTQIDEKLKKDA